MKIVLFVTLFSLLHSNGRATTVEIPPEVPRPPRITLQPKETLYAIREVEIVLECAADAYPDVITSGGYSWMMDDIPLDVGIEGRENRTIVMSQTDGTIRFVGSDKLSESELTRYEGKYQCFAENSLGRAMSRKATIKVAKTPYQRPNDKEYAVRVGDSVDFKCDFEGVPGQVISWSFKRPGVSLSNRISQTSDGLLVFANVLAEDNGLELYCLVKDLATRKSTDGTHYTLNVDTESPVRDRTAVIISPKTEVEPRIRLRGDTLKLTCAAGGNPTPTISWSKLSGKWPADRYQVQDFGHTVLIRNASYSDTAEYMCTASNLPGHAASNSTISIVIESRPFFASDVNKPNDVVQVPGGDVEIRCDVEGLPTPTTEWRVNGKPIADMPQMSNRIVTPNLISLTNLKRSDSAVYQCIATNVHGSLIEQAFVNVLTSAPIPLAGNIDSYKQVAGKSIQLKCLIFGSPPPMITWLRNGEDAMFQEGFAQPALDTMVIQNVKVSDQGKYQCYAENAFGNVTVDFTLDVLQATKIVPVRGHVYNVTVGKSVTMEVKVITDPQLTARSVEWERNGVIIGEGRKRRINDAKYSDAGEYVASVRTSLDSAKTAIKLVVQDSPGMPKGFRYSLNTDPLLIEFQWTAPNDNFAPIEEFKIEFEENVFQPNFWQTLMDGISPGSTSVAADLSPYVNYRFRILARNAVGWGIPSSPSMRYETPVGAPKVNPTGVQGKGTTSSNLIIQWDEVRGIDQNGPGFGYKVSFCRIDQCANDTWQVADVKGTRTRYTVIDTPVFTEYRIKVGCFNDEGNSPEPIAVIGFSGEDVPLSAPAKVVVETSDSEPTRAMLSWQPVPEADVQGHLRGYQISFAEFGGTWSQVAVDNVTSGIIENLTPNGIYQFAVSVFNTLAVGPMSEIVRKQMPESLPGAPSDVRIAKKTFSRLLVAWSAPEQTNGEIIGYSVVYTCFNDSSIRPEPIELSDTKLSLVDMTPLHVYKISVAARTSKGIGPNVTILASTLPPGAPGAVMLNTSSDDKNLTVTWTEPDSLPADKFFVEHRVKGSEEWTRSPDTYTAEQTGTPVLIQGLEPGIVYQLRVVAFNDYGETKSEPVSAVYPGTAPNQGAVSTQIWLFVILALVLFLILVALIVCLVRRRKGGKYSVAEKEGRLNTESTPSNRDEVGEYNDEKDEVKRPLTSDASEPMSDMNGTPTSGAPLVSPLRTRGDSVGGDSINHLGDDDAREFNEDGSFIGQYGTIDESGNNSSTVTSPDDDVERPEKYQGDAV